MHHVIHGATLIDIGSHVASLISAKPDFDSRHSRRDMQHARHVYAQPPPGGWLGEMAVCGGFVRAYALFDLSLLSPCTNSAISRLPWLLEMLLRKSASY
jgi:hypothetical protein